MTKMAVSKKRMEIYIAKLNMESEKAQKALEQGQEMNPDNLMKWIQKMEEIKNKTRTAADIMLDDDDDSLEDSIGVDAEEALKEFINGGSFVNLDSARTRTSSIEYPPSALESGSLVEEILAKAADVHRQFLDDLDQHMTDALQEAELIEEKAITPWHKPRHEAAIKIQTKYHELKESLSMDSRTAHDIEEEVKPMNEEHTWYAVVNIHDARSVKIEKVANDPSSLKNPDAINLLFNDKKDSTNREATAIQSLIRGRVARRRIIQQLTSIPLAQTPEPEVSPSENESSELDKNDADDTVFVMEQHITVKENGIENVDMQNLGTDVPAFEKENILLSAEVVDIEEHNGEDTEAKQSIITVLGETNEWIRVKSPLPKRYGHGTMDRGDGAVSPNFKRCVTPDDLTKSRSLSVDDKISETRIFSLNGEKLAFYRSSSPLSPKIQGDIQQKPSLDSSGFPDTKKEFKNISPQPVARKMSMTKMSAKLNMSSLDLSHTVPEDLDIFLPGSTFVDRGILSLSAKEDTELANLLTELTTIKARRPLSPDKVQKTIESRPYIPIQPPIVSYMTKTTYSTSNKLSPLLRKKMDEDHAGKLHSLWAIKSSLAEAKQITESLKGVSPAEFCETRQSKKFTRRVLHDDNLTMDGRNANNSVWASSTKSTFSANGLDAKQGEPQIFSSSLIKPPFYVFLPNSHCSFEQN
jgi:hypothetical protein